MPVSPDVYRPNPEDLASPEKETRRFLAYNPMRDINRIRALQTLAVDEPALYEYKIAREMAVIQENWERFLGERYGKASFQYTAELRQGLLFPQGSDESLIGIIRKGVTQPDAPLSREDTARNIADLVAMQEVQSKITDPARDHRPKMFVLMSPHGSEGSIFKGRYVDVIDEQANGTYTISRYNTTFALKDMRELGNTLAGLEVFDDNTTSTSIKAKAVEVLSSFSKSDVLRLIGGGHGAITDELYEEILTGTAMLRNNYVCDAQKVPPLAQELSIDYNNIVAAADRIVREYSRKKCSITGMQSNPEEPYIQDVISACGFNGMLEVAGEKLTPEQSQILFGFTAYEFDIDLVGRTMFVDGGSIILDGWPLVDSKGTRIIMCENYDRQYCKNRANLRPYEARPSELLTECASCFGPKGFVCATESTYPKSYAAPKIPN